MQPQSQAQLKLSVNVHVSHIHIMAFFFPYSHWADVTHDFASQPFTGESEHIHDYQPLYVSRGAAGSKGATS